MCLPCLLETVRERGQTVGRLNSRYLGIDKRDTGERPDYWAERLLGCIVPPAINYYLSEELNYKPM